MLDGVSAFPRVLSPLVSPCLPSCFPLLDGVSSFPRPCLPIAFSPRMCACVGWCIYLPEVLPPPPVFLLVSFCWMACPPSRGSYLPLSPIAFLLVPQTVCRSLGVLNAFLRCPPWFCVSAFARVFFPFVCHYTPSCFPLLDGVSAFPRSSPFVSHCLHICSCVGRWCVRLPDVLSSVVSPCLPSSPLVSLLVSPCVSFHMCACVGWCLCLGWCVRLPETLSPLVSRCFPLPPIVSHSLPACVPVLNGVSAFLRSCLPLSPIASHCLPACLPACLPSCLPACLPACLSSCFPLWRVVSFCIFPHAVYG